MTAARAASGPTIAEIKQGLIGRLPQMVAQLCPGMRLHGREWRGPNPAEAGASKRDAAFRIRADSGGWVDFRSGDKGDVIDLIGYAHGYGPRAREHSISWAKDWLGFARMSAEERLAMARQALAAQKAAEKKAAEAKARREANAFKLFLAARPLSPGDPADLYLRGRGLDLAAIPSFNRAGVKFAPDALHWTSGRRAPAMLCAIVVGGVVRAIHATFLESDGGAGWRKLAAPDAKLMLGSVAGGVAELAHGPSLQRASEAAAAGRRDPLILAEGVETALSLALAIPEARVWACLALGNIARAPVDMACVDPARVFVALENDVKPQAVRQRTAMLAALTDRLGVTPKPLIPPVGSDFNDTLQS